MVYLKIAEKSRYLIRNLFLCVRSLCGKIRVRTKLCLGKCVRGMKSASKKIAAKIDALISQRKPLARVEAQRRGDRRAAYLKRAALRVATILRELKFSLTKLWISFSSAVDNASKAIKRRLDNRIRIINNATLNIRSLAQKRRERRAAHRQRVALRVTTALRELISKINNSPLKRWIDTSIETLKTIAGKISAKIKLCYAALTAVGKNWNAKRIDLFLAGSLAALTIGLLLMNLSFEKAQQPQWTELQVSGQWESVFDSDTFNGLIAEFEELNPQLRIKYTMPEKTSGTDTPDTIIANNGNHDLPDIVFMDDSLLSNLIRQEALLPLNSFTQNSSNAGQWAIPLVLSMDLLFYNVDVLQSAGFDRPPKTRNEFLRYARAVQARQGDAYGTAQGLSEDDPHAIHREIFSWLWTAGFPVMKDGKPVLNKNALADLISFLTLINQTGPPDENAFDKTGAQRLHEFAQGRLAMIIAPAQAISVLREQPVDFDFGITYIPETNVPGKTSLGLSGLYAGISGSCAYPNEAWLFLSFLEEKIPALDVQIKSVPGRLDNILPGAQGAPINYLRGDLLYAKAWDIFESSDIAETFSGYAPAAELETAVREELRACFDGDKSAADAADAIIRRWQEIAQ